jgi:hypothetical protein
MFWPLLISSSIFFLVDWYSNFSNSCESAICPNRRQVGLSRKKTGSQASSTALCNQYYMIFRKGCKNWNFPYLLHFSLQYFWSTTWRFFLIFFFLVVMKKCIFTTAVISTLRSLSGHWKNRTDSMSPTSPKCTPSICAKSAAISDSIVAEFSSLFSKGVLAQSYEL